MLKTILLEGIKGYVNMGDVFIHVDVLSTLSPLLQTRRVRSAETLKLPVEMKFTSPFRKWDRSGHPHFITLGTPRGI
jgi:hypothetical protein